MPRKLRDFSLGKRCPRCKETKPVDQFGRSSYTVQGYTVYCKACTVAKHDIWRRGNLEHAARNSKRWRDTNPTLARDHNLKTRYGLPLGEYGKMHDAQNGLCAICKKPSTKGRGILHVDHCHSTGRIRGLLCHGCNVSLGHFDHSPQMLEAAISYLSRTTN